MARTKEVNAAEAALKAPKDEPITIEEVQASGTADLEVVKEDELSKLARQENFMNELVGVRLHKPHNESDAPFVPIQVGDYCIRVWRDDRPYRIKRKYVEVLARAKTTRFSQERRNINGEEVIFEVPSTALTYPFSVIEDKHPKGHAWLERVLAEPA